MRTYYGKIVSKLFMWQRALKLNSSEKAGYSFKSLGIWTWSNQMCTLSHVKSLETSSMETNPIMKLANCVVDPLRLNKKIKIKLKGYSEISGRLKAPYFFDTHR